MPSPPENGEPELIPDLPDPTSRRRVSSGRPIVMAAVLGGGVALLAVIIGLVLLGLKDNADEQISSTGLASIGATLAGGFAGWIARGVAGGGQQQSGGSSERRRDDP